MWEGGWERCASVVGVNARVWFEIDLCDSVNYLLVALLYTRYACGLISILIAADKKSIRFETYSAFTLTNFKLPSLFFPSFFIIPLARSSISSLLSTSNCPLPTRLRHETSEV